MKSINLIQSRLAFPAAGLPLDTFVEIPEKEESQKVVERRRLPFFLRGSIILTLGVVLLAAAVYYTLIRPVDLSDKPQPIGPGERAVMAQTAKVPEPARKPAARPSESIPGKTTSPIFIDWLNSAPPSGPLSPSARRPIGEPPPVKKSSMPAISMSEKKKEEEKAAESKPETTPPSAEIKTAKKPVDESPLKKPVAPEKAEPKKSPSAEAKPPAKPTKVAKVLPAEASPRKKVPEPGPEKTAAVPKGRYSIQVGACRRPKCVSSLTARLKKAEFEPITETSRNGKLTLILTGEYQTLRATRSDLEKLQERGFKGSYAIER